MEQDRIYNNNNNNNIIIMGLIIETESKIKLEEGRVIIVPICLYKKMTVGKKKK